MRCFGLLILMLCCVTPAGTRAGGDAEHGRKLSVQHCARCHVVGDYNKYGGIGSTPSFYLLAGLPDWRDRFRTFFERRPHPVHVRVEDIPKRTDLPSNAAEFTISLSDVDDILAFAGTLRGEP